MVAPHQNEDHPEKSEEHQEKPRIESSGALPDPKDSSLQKGSDSTSSTTTDTTPAASSSLDVRQTIGSGIHSFSDVVNENLIAARYAALASIALLAAYGISQTPLFFRYRTVSEIPSRLFTSRKTITGRLMLCRRDNNNNNKNSSDMMAAANKNASAVTCYVRHLSPIERLLSKSWLDWMLKIHPAATLRRERPEENPNELLRVQVAGVVYPSLPLPEPQDTSSSSSSIREQISIPSTSDSSSSNREPAGKAWLQALAEQRAIVKCQLLGREIPVSAGANDSNISASGAAGRMGRNKRPIPGLAALTNSTSAASLDHNRSSSHEADGEGQVAVAYVRYYPKRYPILGTDLGESMVKAGRAIPSEDGLYTHAATERVVDATDNVKLLRKDAAYVERLESAEYQACTGSYGIWADPAYRESRSDVVEEVEFQQSASFLKKTWRWLRR